MYPLIVVYDPSDWKKPILVQSAYICFAEEVCLVLYCIQLHCLFNALSELKVPSELFLFPIKVGI